MLPDERDMLIDMMKEMADEDHFDLILTTGGTGLGRRDVTPEATLEVIGRRTPGLPEAMRNVPAKDSLVYFPENLHLPMLRIKIVIGFTIL